MKSQAFAFPDVLIRCFPSCVVSRYDTEFFSIGLVSLIIPKFSVFLQYTIIHGRGACAQLLLFAVTCFRKPPGSLVSLHFTLYLLPPRPQGRKLLSGRCSSQICFGDHVGEDVTCPCLWSQWNLYSPFGGSLQTGGKN